MESLENLHYKIWSIFLELRSFICTITYSMLLFYIVSEKNLNSGTLLYLEVYNITLFYIILNMLLFAKDILHPKIKNKYSRGLIELLLIISSSAILIISLYLFRNTINDSGLGNVVVKINALAVIVLSVYIFWSSSSPSHKSENK